MKNLILLFSLSLVACSSNDDNDSPDSDSLNPDVIDNSTTAIAGLWDGTTTLNDVSDEVFWNFTEDGLLTRYDFQQDGAMGASGENCYLIDGPIAVTSQGGDDYFLSDVAVTITPTPSSLILMFSEADRNDLDANGDSSEMPTFMWPPITNMAVVDLNECSTEMQPSPSGEQPGTGLPVDVFADRETISQDECLSQGGSIVGDIGNGAIFTPEFRCDSGAPPIANIGFVEGEVSPVEGSVCCV